MNPRNAPFLRLLLPFATGVAFAGVLDDPFPGLHFLTGASLFFTLLLAFLRYQYRFRWVFGACLYTLFCCGGYFLTIEYNELRAPGHFSKEVVTPHYFVGLVYEAPSRGTKLHLPIAVEAGGSRPDSLKKMSGNLLLFVDDTVFSRTLRYGDRLLFRCTPQRVAPPGNPGAFDYRRYLHFHNIHYQSFVKPDSIQVVSTGNGNLLWRLAYDCRDHLLRLLEKNFPTHDELGVAEALLLGYKDDLSDEIRNAYVATGSMHALAVSGTHIGILYIGLAFLTRRLRLRGRGRWLETALFLAAIWAFTLLTGASPAVLRASVMFTVYMLGKSFYRQSSAWNVLPASAFGLLLYNPYFLFDVGFQLSYTAVAGMVFFYPRLYKLFPPGPRWRDEVVKVLLVGVSAQLGTLPLQLYYFNQFPVYFWLAGWIVVFGGALFLWGGALLALLDVLWPWLGVWLGKVLYEMVFWMNKSIFFIQELPGSVAPDIWIPAWVALLLYVAIACIGALLVWRRALSVLLLLGIFGTLGLYRISSRAHKQTQRVIVVYQMPKRSRLIDFFEGNQAVTLADSVSQKQESFAARPLRIASAIQRQLKLLWNERPPFCDNNLLIDKPFIQFFQKKMLLLDDEKWLRECPPVAVDVLIISQNPRVSIADCYKKFPFQLVVLDASNSRKKAARWEQECTAHNWPCHDVRTRGAWVWQENPHQ